MLLAAIGVALSLRSLRHNSKAIKSLRSQTENVEARLDVLDEREKRPTQPYRDPATGKETQVICVDCRYCEKGVDCRYCEKGDSALICRAQPVAPKPEYKTPHFKVCAVVNKNRDCPDFKPLMNEKCP